MSRRKQNIDEPRYVDMCIWIDEHAYTDNFDEEKAYDYMFKIARMLAWKSKDKWTLPSAEDYTAFAHFLAYDVYKQYTQRDVDKRGKIKSVLNYMKGIIRFRRMTYLETTKQRIKDPKFDAKFDSQGFKTKLKQTFESNNRDAIILETEALIESLPHLIKKSIPKVYKNQRNLYKNIYISSLLTLLDKFTLPNKSIRTLDDRMDLKPKYEASVFIRKQLSETTNQVILWNLDKSKTDIVKLVVNNTINLFIEDLRDICKDNEISDNEFSDISSTAFGVTDERY